MAGLTAFVLLLTAGGRIITRRAPAQFIWGSIFIIVGVVWLVLLQEKRLPVKTWQIGLLAFCLFDLCVVDSTMYIIRPAKTVLAESGQAAKYLSQQPGSFRVVFAFLQSSPANRSALRS